MTDYAEPVSDSEKVIWVAFICKGLSAVTQLGGAPSRFRSLSG